MVEVRLIYIVLHALLYLQTSFGKIYDYKDTVDYYVDLIETEEWKSSNFPLPTNNSEFKLNDDNGHATYVGSYDFVIVGAGAAGSVLAKRLSEVEEWNILIIEAGTYETNFSEIPAESEYLHFSKKNWGYQSISQKYGCKGMIDHKCNIPRGKSVGGSGAIGNSIHYRGSKLDFDRWANTGARGWSFLDNLPYFKKLENSEINGDWGYHGKDGPLNVVFSKPPSDLLGIWYNANKELGADVIDYNGKHQLGVARAQVNLENGRRQSTGKAYLARANTKKLDVSTDSLVTKILFDSRGRAKSVIFNRYGKRFVVDTRKEILLSAGAINTPQLLMLSGIGPKKHLLQHGIPIVRDLAVGQYLQQQYAFNGLNFRANKKIFGENSLKENVENYLVGKGPLTKTVSSDSLSFGLLNNNTTLPGIEFVLVSSNSKIRSRVLNWNQEIIDSYSSKLNPHTDFTILIILLHPKSIGRILLKSSDPLDFPNIDLNIFAEHQDISDLYEGVQKVFDLVSTESFKNLGVSFIDYPVCGNLKKYDFKYWKCAIKHLTTSLNHPIGTTPIGYEKRSVVDDLLRVHNTYGLRVIDAGVIPYTLSGNAHATTVMIAEKASDIIKSTYIPKYDWNNRAKF